MYEMMLNRKTNKKGFTLVEVIVVLVILAILAAIMIPAMTGWIDEAKEKSVYVEARSALLAAQTLASEVYGGARPAADIGDNFAANVQKIAGVEGTISSVLYVSTTAGAKGAYQIAALTYTPKTGSAVKYTYSSDTGVGTWAKA